jgi:hypothetical protein
LPDETAKAQIHVGVVGHRPNRLPKDDAGQSALRATIGAILLAVRSAVQPASLCAITSLAEGADRVFAEEALALDCPLFCPMPFVQTEFEKDFVPPSALESSSLAHFRALLQQARLGPGLTVLELGGSRADAPSAYAAAGRAILKQSDLLVGVWDGGAAAGHGGTAETLHEGLGLGIPVFWIDTRAPESWKLLRSEADLAPHAGPEGQARPDLGATVAQVVTSVFPH